MPNPLCKYSGLFGKPNDGLRQYRIFDIAIYDTVVVVLTGFLISYFSGWSIYPILVVLFVSGIIAHRLFCVRSGVDKLLFSS
jgi:hypothetical protein